MNDVFSKLIERMERARINANNAQPEAAPQYECQQCKDTEWIFKCDKNGYEYAVRCKCYEKKKARRLMMVSGISDDDSRKGFKDFKTFDEIGLTVAKSTAVKYYSDFEEIKESRNNSILLCGLSGRGKTTLGMAVANNLIARCYGVRYMAYRDEVTQLKQEITDEYAYNEHMRRLKFAKILFIDDMLKGKITDSDINILYEVINHRYLERLPMIISTEKTTSDLLEFDEAIGSRVLEMCKGYVVTFDINTPNYRMR